MELSPTTKTALPADAKFIEMALASGSRRRTLDGCVRFDLDLGRVWFAWAPNGLLVRAFIERERVKHYVRFEVDCYWDSGARLRLEGQVIGFNLATQRFWSDAELDTFTRRGGEWETLTNAVLEDVARRPAIRERALRQYRKVQLHEIRETLREFGDELDSKVVSLSALPGFDDYRVRFAEIAGLIAEARMGLR